MGQFRQHWLTEKKILSTLATVDVIGGIGMDEVDPYPRSHVPLPIGLKDLEVHRYIVPPYHDRGVREIARQASVSAPTALKYLRILRKKKMVRQLRNKIWTANPTVTC